MNRETREILRAAGPELDVLVRAMMAEPWPCILCGKPTRDRGAFLPGPADSPMYGVPPAGKARLIVYARCVSHGTDADTAAQCEEVLAARVANGN